MSKADRRYVESPSQTAGPYVHIGCTPNAIGLAGIYDQDIGSSMISGPIEGQKITLFGVIFDGIGEPLKDAMVEIWQADSRGVFQTYNNPRKNAESNFNGFGRAACDLDTGEFHFHTLKPGRVPYHDGRLQAPHISLWIVARGINLGLHTRVYFADEPRANGADPILNLIEPQERLPTLLAHRETENKYRFDIYLQGDNETVFFDI